MAECIICGCYISELYDNDGLDVCDKCEFLNEDGENDFIPEDKSESYDEK